MSDTNTAHQTPHEQGQEHYLVNRVQRRTVVKAAAWSLPVISAAVAAPAFGAASGGEGTGAYINVDNIQAQWGSATVQFFNDPGKSKGTATVVVQISIVRADGSETLLTNDSKTVALNERGDYSLQYNGTSPSTAIQLKVVLTSAGATFNNAANTGNPAAGEYPTTITIVRDIQNP